MREDICTIPISDVFEENDGCPICRMRNTIESVPSIILWAPL